MTKPLLIAAIVSVLAPGVVAGQTTAFNFNGHLSHLGLPVNGRHDLRFALYGSQAGADLVSGPIVVNSVAVRGGIFNCRLDFGEQVFNGSARWLDISVRPNGTENFTRLSPRVELTSAPYAVRAKEASFAANVATGSAVRSLNNLKDNVALAAGPNVTLTTNGNTLTIGSTPVSDGPWSTQTTNVYYTGGNVGVGKTQPQGLVDIHSGVSDTSALYVRADPSVVGRGGIIHHQSATYGWQEVAQGTGLANAGSLAFHYVQRTAPGIKMASNVMTLRADGKVGLGTDAPTSRLDILGSQDALKITGYEPLMTLRDSNSGNARGVIQNVGGGLNFLSEDYLNNSSPAGFMRLNNDGNVGIGTALPTSKLDVRGALTLDTGGNGILFTSSGGGEQNRYLNLFNSPTHTSASGLKAGGVLVADDYAYANPGKNDLVVKGKVTTGGDVIQNRDNGGLAKAMVKVNADGTIARQYCAYGGTITADVQLLGSERDWYGYKITFPFKVDDRYVTVTLFAHPDLQLITADVYLNGNDVSVVMHGRDMIEGDDFMYVQHEFMLVVF